MALPPQLEQDLEALRSQGYKVEPFRDPPTGNIIYLVFTDYPLPKGWNKPMTKLLLITDISYPNSKIDMFWVDQDLRLADGERIPQAGGTIETYMGQSWYRFSWHVQKWNPAVDNVISYLGTVDTRLGQLH
jgi:hypothetical protein